MFNGLRLLLAASLFVCVDVVGAAPVPIPLPTANGQLLSKAQPDECFNGIGQNYPPGPPCASGQPKVNQAYVWGLAKTGNAIWFGTVPNTHCLVQGVFLGSTSPYQTGSWVCEFGSSRPAALLSLPAPIGDFRPPRIYVYDTVTQTTTEKTLGGGAAALLSSTIGIRAAGTLGDVVLLAGPALGGGINVFAFQASTGLLIGAQNLSQYVNIRKFVVVNGVLYAGVGLPASAPPAKLGRVLRWTGSVGTPIAFEEVARLDSMAAELALHDGRLFVTSWPEGGGSVGPREAGLYMSPEIPQGGFTSGNIADWDKVWAVSDYEPDPVTAATYGGGALASFDGYLYWGTMHVPTLSTIAHSQVYSADWPTDEAGQLQWFLRSERAISIFRGRNFASASPQKEVVYGYPQMPVFVKVGATPGTWQAQANRMGPPRWGPAGFNSPLNNYTWSMAVSGGRLWVGTMDWSWLLASAGTLSGTGVSANAVRSSFPGSDGLAGADLWYFPASNSPAFPESTAGVGNPSSYGIRNMIVGPNLYLGMANPMNLLTDPAAGPTGGWELLELAERSPNTTTGGRSAVQLEGGASITFCRVQQAGYTASRFLPFSQILPASIPLPWRPTDALLITSSADWRGDSSTECGWDGIARVTVPYNGLAAGSRMLQLVWRGESGTWAWENITSSVDSESITGTLTGEFLGVLAIQPLKPVPTLSQWVMIFLAALLGLVGFFRLRRA